MKNCIFINRQPYYLKGVYQTIMKAKEKGHEYKKKKHSRFFILKSETNELLGGPAFLLYARDLKQYTLDKKRTKEYGIDILTIQPNKTTA